MKEDLDDIIRLPHHVSPRHPPMSMHDRAAQFAPFAALTGFGDVIDEAGRRTERKRELGEHELAVLDRRLNLLAEKLPEHPEITLEYFVPDERMTGGGYVVISGSVAKISVPDKTIVMQDGRTIRLDDVTALDGPVFDAADTELQIHSNQEDWKS